MRLWLFVCLVLTFAPRVRAQVTTAPSGIVNATGYQQKLAPDTVFVIFGTGMGPAALAAATAPDYPTTLAGTSISFTPAAGGTAIAAKMIYTFATQVAGLLPSSIAPGTYAVRVTYNGQSSPPQNVSVVARSFGIATANSAGSGPAQATIGNLNGGISLVRFTSGTVDFGGHSWSLSPAHPGDTLVLWGTGGGADPANDTGGTSGDQTAAGNFKVTVAGQDVTPLYAGASSGYPGLWQVNFTVPANATADCFAPVQVSAGNEKSNWASIAIAPRGQNECTDPDLPPAALSKLDKGGTFTAAVFAIAKITETTQRITQETASGAVFRYTTAAWLLKLSGPKFGPCQIYDRTYPQTGRDPSSPQAALDAGPRLPLAGPGLAAGAALPTLATPDGPVYPLLLTSGTLAPSGHYTLTGNGGTQVGAFSTATDFPASFTATNFDSITAINRATPLTFTWTAAGSTYVYIVISSAARVAPNLHIATITCTVPASAGTFTVPAAALGYLLPTDANTFSSVSIQAASAAGQFTAPLVAGGQTDLGLFGANLGVSKNVPVQ